MRFVLYLVGQGHLTARQAIDVLRQLEGSAPPIGALAQESRLLGVKQIMQVLAAQLDQPDQRFGELAVSLGLLQADQVGDLLCAQARRRQGVLEALRDMGLDPAPLRPAAERYGAVLGLSGPDPTAHCPDRLGLCSQQPSCTGVPCPALGRRQAS